MTNNLTEEKWLFDLVLKKSPDDEQVAFYDRQVARFGQPVLELAIGSGNHLATLTPDLQSLFDLDFEEDLSSEPTNSTEFIAGDMRSFSIDQKFRLILAAGNSLQHLLTIEDVESCFESVRTHLFPYGKFIVEVFNPSLELLTRDSEKRHFVGEYKTENGWIVITQNVFYDAATQVNHIDWHYQNQYVKEEQTLSFAMRQFFPQELDSLFRYNGFCIEAKYGDFSENPFTRNSQKQIIIAGLA